MTASDERLSAVPAPFEARIIGSGERAVRIVVKGELDLAATPRLEQVMARAFDVADELVLDLSQTSFIDSSGLYGLVSAVRQAQTAGKTLSISATLNPQVARLFDLVGMRRMLPIVDD